MFFIYFIGIVFAIIGLLVQSKLKAKIAFYSKTSLRSGMSGKEVAEKMLKDNGIFSVKVISVEGQLTDHYHPGNRTVNLSHDVYHGRNAAAAAIAAHECGHAVQHNQSYAFLGFRSALVPMVNISGTVLPWFIMFGIMLIHQLPGLLLLAIIAQALLTIFTLITLPVEFDASRRALQWMTNSGIVIPVEYEASKDALKWAAMTYVVAATASITQLIYLIHRYSSRRGS